METLDVGRRRAEWLAVLLAECQTAKVMGVGARNGLPLILGTP